MNHTLIKALIAAAALVALAVFVFRAQSDDPAPQEAPVSNTLTSNPVLPPAAGGDAVPALQPLVREPAGLVLPASTAAGAAETAEEQAAPLPEVELEHPEPLFLPTTNTAGLTPVEQLDGDEQDTD